MDPLEGEVGEVGWLHRLWLLCQRAFMQDLFCEHGLAFNREMNKRLQKTNVIE